MYSIKKDEIEVKRTGAKSHIAAVLWGVNGRVQKFCPFLSRPVTPGAPLRRQFLNNTDLTVCMDDDTIEEINEEDDDGEGSPDWQKESDDFCKPRERTSSRPQSEGAGDGDGDVEVEDIMSTTKITNSHEKQTTSSSSEFTESIKDFESWTNVQGEEEEEDDDDDDNGSVLSKAEEDTKWNFEDVAPDTETEENDNKNCPILGDLTFEVQDKSIKIGYTPRTTLGALKNVSKLPSFTPPPIIQSSQKDPPDTILDEDDNDKEHEYNGFFENGPQLVASEEQWRRAASARVGHKINDHHDPQKFQRRFRSACYCAPNNNSAENTLNYQQHQKPQAKLNGCFYPPPSPLEGSTSSKFYDPSQPPPPPSPGEYYDCPTLSSTAYPDSQGNPFQASTAYPDFPPPSCHSHHRLTPGTNVNRYQLPPPPLDPNVSTPFQSNNHNCFQPEPGFHNNNMQNPTTYTHPFAPPPPLSHQNNNNHNICMMQPTSQTPPNSTHLNSTPGIEMGAAVAVAATGGGNAMPVNDKSFGQYSNNCNFFIYNMTESASPSSSSSSNNNYDDYNYGQPPPDYYDVVNCRDHPHHHQPYSPSATTRSILSGGPKGVRDMLRPFQRFF